MVTPLLVYKFNDQGYVVELSSGTDSRWVGPVLPPRRPIETTVESCGRPHTKGGYNKETQKDTKHAFRLGDFSENQLEEKNVS